MPHFKENDSHVQRRLLQDVLKASLKDFFRKSKEKAKNTVKMLQSLFSSRSRHPRPALETRLVGTRVMLRAGDPEDWQSWRNLRAASRAFLEPWEPTWPSQALTYDFFCGNLRRQWREWRSGTDYAFLVFGHGQDGNPENGPLLGGIALNDIQRGIAQKGTLGYWVGLPYAGQGVMTEAAGLVCDFALKTLELHRVEASCLPHNEPSRALLRKLGFTEEGYAKGYLRINGQWEDHLLWGLVGAG